MNIRIPASLLTVLLLAMDPKGAVAADEQKPATPAAAIVTEFIPGAVLTGEQVEIVRQLALKAGLPSVGKVKTYNIHPGPDCYIRAISQEEVSGREYRLTSVIIHYQKEGWEPNFRDPGIAVHRMGDFWTTGITPDDRLRGGIYDYRGKPLRVVLGDDVPVAFGDPIVAAFAAGKIRFEKPGDQKTADRFKDGELTPSGIGKADGTSFRVGIVSWDENAWMTFVSKMGDDGTLSVVSVGVMMS